MLMTREESRKWAESLRPGDEVIVSYGGIYRIGTVKRVTPAGRVVVEKYGTYFQNKYDSLYTERGRAINIVPNIVPFDEKLAEIAKKQEKIEADYKGAMKLFREAKAIAYDWAFGNRDLSYDLAKKIIALADEKEE